MKVAVIAPTGKTMGGGLSELRSCLAQRGIDDPLWFEVPKSKQAPTQVRRALELDGGDRRKVSSFEVAVEPGALTVCTPASAPARNASRGDQLVHSV
jgi:hypothetical protein